MTKGWQTDEIGLFDINFETGERYWSVEFRHLIEVPIEEPADFHLFLKRVHPDDRRHVMAAAMGPMRPDPEPHSSVEFRVLKSDGREHWIRAETAVVFRRNGSRDAIRAVGFAIEVASPGGWGEAAARKVA